MASSRRSGRPPAAPRRRTRSLIRLVAVTFAVTIGSGMLGGLDAPLGVASDARAWLSPTAGESPGSPGGLPDRSVASGEGQDPAGCRLIRGHPVRVRIDPRRYPAVARHLRAVRRSGRYPRVWRVDRAGADANREQAIDHWEATKGRRFSETERRGRERDEAPPAISNVGGRWRGKERFRRLRFASVRLVPESQNAGAGASLGNQLRPYCSGSRFVLVGR